MTKDKVEAPVLLHIPSFSIAGQSNVIKLNKQSDNKVRFETEKTNDEVDCKSNLFDLKGFYFGEKRMQKQLQNLRFRGIVFFRKKRKKRKKKRKR